MVQGLKFLSKKGFHPKNLANQKKVWEREQQTKQEADRLAERQKTLERERDDEELRRSRGDVKLEFMYQAPPGLEKKKPETVKSSESTKGPRDLTRRQPGDDDAAAAFRQLLAAGASHSNTPAESDQADQDVKAAFGSTVLHGSSVDTALPDRKALSALEQAVGRKKTDAPTTTLDEQLERFPALKNAPRMRNTAGDSAAVQFKPLGAQIRNVRCLTCGVWGHQRGDRECQVSGWNPFSAPVTSSVKPDTDINQKTGDVARETKESGERGRIREDSPSSGSESDSDDSEERHRKKHKRRKHERKRKSSKKSKSKSRDRKRRDRSRSVERSRKKKSRR